METELADGATLRLRPATAADIPLLRQWDHEPHVMAATGNDGSDDDPWDWADTMAMAAADPARPFWWNFIAEWFASADAVPLPIGFVQVIDPAREPTHYWGSDVGSDARAIDVWIGPPDFLGKGFGTAMMRLAIDWCFADPAVSHILIDPLAANQRAIRFYHALGFKRLSQRQFGEDSCLVLRLDRARKWYRIDRKAD